jgi:flagellin
VITAATKASAAKYIVTVDAEDAADKTLQVNGYTISYTATDDGEENAALIAAAINAVSDQIGATASVNGDELTISSIDVGSAASLSISAAADVLVDDASVNSTTTGSDADIGSTQITDAQYIARGNTITVISGDYKGLELQLNAEVMSGTADENVATFKITGNGSVILQIGANEGQEMSISIGDMRAAALGVSTINVTTQTSASSSITIIDNAIKFVSGERSKLGAYQNRLEHTINNLGTSAENLTAAESRIRDVDMAKEMMEFTKNNILTQAAQAMLAQANLQPQGVLQLLR